MNKDFDEKRVEKVAIDELIHPEWNPKDDEDSYHRVKKSVEVNGLMMPVFVREVGDGYELVDGNQRVRAAKELGYSDIYVYNLGAISEEEAKQLVLYMQVRVPFDSVLLAPLAVKLEAIGMELPFDEKEMAGFREIEAFDMSAGFGEETPLEIEKKDALDAKEKNLRVKLELENYDFVNECMRKVEESENVSSGRALELLCCPEVREQGEDLEES